MRIFGNDQAVYSWVRVPSYLCGWSNILHGGITSALLDEIMGWAGMYSLRKCVLTKSIMVNYLKPVYMDVELRVEGRVLEVKNAREVVVEGLLYGSEDTLCASAISTMATFPVEVLEKLGIAPDEEAVANYKNIFEMEH